MTITDEVRARLFLLRATEPPARATHAYVIAHGPVEAAERIRGGGAPPAVLAEITQPNPGLDLDLEALDSGTARLVTPKATTGHWGGSARCPATAWVHRWHFGCAGPPP